MCNAISTKRKLPPNSPGIKMIQGNEKYAFGHCNVTINNISHQIIQNKSKR